jgi:nucleotide-binding universal stress UspA family protein
MLTAGTPYREVLRIAGDVKADLIVLGVYGRNPLSLAALGSTTNQVLRHVTYPVLTVRT